MCVCARVDVLIIKLILLGTYWSTNKGRRIRPREAGSESNPWDGVIDQSQASSKTINSFLFIHSQGKERKEKKRKEKKRKEKNPQTTQRLDSFIHSFLSSVGFPTSPPPPPTASSPTSLPAMASALYLSLSLTAAAPTLPSSPPLSSRHKRREEKRLGQAAEAAAAAQIRHGRLGPRRPARAGTWPPTTRPSIQGTRRGCSFLVLCSSGRFRTRPPWSFLFLHLLRDLHHAATLSPAHLPSFGVLPS